MIGKYKILRYLEHDAAEWDTLFDETRLGNARLWNDINYLKAKGYIEEDVLDDLRSYYKIAYKGVIRAYIYSRVELFFGAVGFVGGLCGIAALIIA